MQNDVLKVMSHSVLRKLATSLQSSKFLTVMADETADISNKEQVVIFLVG